MARIDPRHGVGSRGGVSPRIAADMNVTPLVDVLLVLLVIFMAALPLVQKGVSADLPEPAPSVDAGPAAAIVVDVAANRRLSINHQDVAAGELGLRLRQIFGERRDKTLFISAAAALRYRDVIEVIDTAKGAGVERVGIITLSGRSAPSR